MYKSFSFKGITRNCDNLLAAEGECLDAVNLRMINGSLKPVPQPLPVVSLPYRYKAIGRHEAAGCYVCITENDGSLHFYDSNWVALTGRSGDGPLRFDELSGVLRVEMVGNILCCFTADSINYMLFDSGTYRNLGVRPPVPAMRVATESKIEKLTTAERYAVHANADNFEASWGYNEKGYLDECVSMLNKTGHYVDRCLFRFALRLYDGSYIYCSHIVYVSDECYDNGVGRDARNFQSESLGAVDNYAYFNLSVRGFKPVFSFHNLFLDDWKGIVVGIDLFSTGSIPGHKADNVQASFYNSETGSTTHMMKEAYVVKSMDELVDDISSASLYYKVAEFDIQGNCIFSLDDVSDVNLALQHGLQQELSVESLSTYSAECSYVLNNRLHIASLKEWLFKGYDSSAFLPAACKSSEQTYLVVHTTIKTSHGTYVVENDCGTFDVGFGYNTLELPPLLAYPDSRATEMTLYLFYDTELFAKSFPLTPHKYLNMSQYVHRWYSPYTVTVEAQFASGASASYISDSDVIAVFDGVVGVHEVIYSSEKNSWLYNGNLFPPEEYASLRIFGIPRDVADGDKLVFTISAGISSTVCRDVYNIPLDSTWKMLESIPPVNAMPCVERTNVLKVSMVDNPFSFPAELTYAPSQSEVVALSSNTVALSQGQFGQHPLYVFCSDGIWALSVDTSGALAYGGCYPLSREKCINSQSVCGVDSGVIFAGEQGLMLLQGSSMKRISAAMHSASGSEKILSSLPFERVASIVALSDSAEACDFETYLSKAMVHYFALHNEVVICCSEYSYSYLFSLDYGAWSRVTWRFSGTVNDCTSFRLFLKDDSRTVVNRFCSEASGYNRVLLFTRPMLFGTKLPKRVVQLMMHCTAVLSSHPTPGMPLLSCYMLCSNDGVHYKISAGAETECESNDLRFPYFPSQSYRYFLFAVAGELGENGLITGIELDVNSTWNRRM